MTCKHEHPLRLGECPYNDCEVPDAVPAIVIAWVLGMFIGAAIATIVCFLILA